MVNSCVSTLLYLIAKQPIDVNEWERNVSDAIQLYDEQVEAARKATAAKEAKTAKAAEAAHVLTNAMGDNPVAPAKKASSKSNMMTE